MSTIRTLAKKTRPFDTEIQEVNLYPHSVRVSVLANWIVAYSIFEYIIINRISDFVKMMWLAVVV